MKTPQQKKLTPKEFEATVNRLTKRAQRLAAEINQLGDNDGSVLKLYNALNDVSHGFNMRAIREREVLITKGLRQHAEDVRTGKAANAASTTLPEDLILGERWLREDEARRAYSAPIRISR